MATSGSGELTPIWPHVPPVPVPPGPVPCTQRATHLSLSRYAKLLGLDPMHFFQGISVLRPEAECSDIWYQYDWQSGDKVSREYVLQLIGEAEMDIATALGFWPAPTFIEEERHIYPKPQRTDLVGYGVNARGRWKSLQARWGKVLGGGVCVATELGTVSYTLLDSDNDGFSEWAVFTLTVPTTVSAPGIRAYHTTDYRTDPDSSGPDPHWEIRPIRATVSGSTLTVYVPRWKLFDPALQEELSPHPINADELTSYVNELVFYHACMSGQTQVLFGWSNDATCATPACAWQTQTGCLHVQNQRSGTVVPEPATYDADTNSFAPVGWTGGVEPDIMWLYYRSGEMARRVGAEHDPLDDYWARTIMILTTARLDRPLCTCTNVELRVDRWRQDMRLVKSDAGSSRSYQLDPTAVTNPFGTRVGEVEAWLRVKGRAKRVGRAVKT